MSGDQVYADDIAGPMLGAVHQLVARLGLPNELLEGATVPDSEVLCRDHAAYYRRERLLPTSRVNRRLREIFFGGARKPIFTADNAHNHRITLDFEHRHYQWPTNPPLLVIDTRTHRWRSERGVDRPSGLMDWEALTDLQSEILDRDAVILVSPAPMFGVKLIEAIQQRLSQRVSARTVGGPRSPQPLAVCPLVAVELVH